MSKPALFLDRDGVLNRSFLENGKPQSPRKAEEVEILPEAVEACALFYKADIPMIVVTNQPDLARGKVTNEEMTAIHEIIHKHFSLADIRICPHDDCDHCHCRKPKAGLLLDAARDHGFDLSKSIMVGDRWRDVEAGLTANCKTVFIDLGYQEKKPREADFVCANLLEAAPWILKNMRV